MTDTRVILALGSNTRQETSMEEAQRLLRELLPDIVFSRCMWTEPIGIRSEMFLNCMAQACTTLNLAQLKAAIKDIEQAIGDRNKATNTIPMDIDLMQYGSRRFKEDDWKREYIVKLKNEIM